MKNKKGVMPLWISLFFSILTVILLLFFYFLFLRGSREPNLIAAEESFATGAHTVLTTYLNSPVVVQGKPMTLSDLIRLWYQDRAAYEQLLVAQSDQLLARSEFDYADVDGTTRRRVFWIAIHEPPRGGKVLLVLHAPGQGRTGAGKAEAFVPVSETAVVRVIAWSMAI